MSAVRSTPPKAPELDIRKTYKLYIDGKFVRTESGRTYQVAGGRVNAPRGSRKDVRNAVAAARKAFDGWSGRTAYNRGQVIYRIAEMLDARRGEFVSLLGKGPAAEREVDQAVDSLVWYAGWCDKLHAVAGTVNPVAGPYFNFTFPEPTGVVGLIAPEEPALLGLVRHLAPALCGGNVIVALVSESQPLAGLVFGEVLATSDVPAGVVNLVSGSHSELLAILAGHMDVNAIDVAACNDSEVKQVQLLAEANVKRIVRSDGTHSLEAITSLMEMKTVWHPIGH